MGRKSPQKSSKAFPQTSADSTLHRCRTVLASRMCTQDRTGQRVIMATSHTRSRGAGTQFADRWWFLVRVTARGPGDLSPPICFRRTWTFFFDPFRATCARSTPAPSLLWVLLTHATHNHTRCTHIHTRIPHRRLYSLPQSMPPSLPSPCLPPPSCMHNDAVPLYPLYT